MAEEHGQFLDGAGITADQAVTTLEEGARRSAGEFMSNVDSSLAMMQGITRTMVDTCVGPVTLRARKKPVELQATLCTSLTPNPRSDSAAVTRRLV